MLLIVAVIVVGGAAMPLTHNGSLHICVRVNALLQWCHYTGPCCRLLPAWCRWWPSQSPVRQQSRCSCLHLPSSVSRCVHHPAVELQPCCIRYLASSGRASALWCASQLSHGTQWCFHPKHLQATLMCMSRMQYISQGSLLFLCTCRASAPCRQRLRPGSQAVPRHLQ